MIDSLTTMAMGQVRNELAKKAVEAAALLQRAGAGARPVAAVTASSSIICLLYHATKVLGLPLMPLDPALPDEVIESLLAQSDPAVVVGERKFSVRAMVAPAAILAAEASADAPTFPTLAPDAIALMVATSGSSGHPKAVMLSVRNLHAAAAASASRTPLGVGDRWLACLPLFHIGGFSILSRCELAGAEAILHEGFSAERVWRSLQTEGITHLSLVPAMLAQLIEFADGQAPSPTLHHVLVGGAALSSELAERAARLGWPLQPTYGMSETASQVATLSRLPACWRQGHVGKPLPGVELGQDPEGRLKIRGPMVMAGYANSDLIPGDGLEDGWFVTNDLAEITPDGELVVTGRADDVIVSGGKKVQPSWVEDAVARCPGITAVGVVGRPDPSWGQVVTAVYSGTITSEALLDWCRLHIGGAMRPRVALQVAALPRLASGKPDRRALRELASGKLPSELPSGSHC